MSFLSIDKVHGDHLVDRKTVAALPTSSRMVDVSRIVSAVDGPVDAATVRMLLGRPVIEAVTPKRTWLFDAADGRALGQISQRDAVQIAASAWRGDGHPAASAAAVSNESTEYRGVLPAWRVAFADNDHTAVFVAAETGRITAVRTGTWRLYDFFWGLHIMDWKNHENFNSWWLLAFALGGLTLGLAGTALLFMRPPIRRRRRIRDIVETGERE